jgi:hypothetical protein
MVEHFNQYMRFSTRMLEDGRDKLKVLFLIHFFVFDALIVVWQIQALTVTTPHS